MPPRRRAVAELKWGWQLSNQEIVAVLGITDKAVSSHVTAARAALRQAREELEDNDVRAPEGGSGR
jgi:DNA-directed RNA polymerase specialized sigma24 family protein